MDQAAHIFVFTACGRVGGEWMLRLLNATGQVNIVRWSPLRPLPGAVDLRPHPFTGRGGFKCEYVDSLATLEQFFELYPQARFVFMKREPVSQWRSVKKMGLHPYSDDVKAFADERDRLLTIYKAFGGILVDNSQLGDWEFIINLFEKLELSCPNVQRFNDKKIWSLGPAEPATKEELKVLRRG